MVEREEYDPVRPEPSMDTVIRIGWTVTILAFIVTVISGVGEYLGWWNLVGEVGLTAGTMITVVVGVGTLAANAGRSQVGGVREAVEDNGATLMDIDGQLDKLDKLDKLDQLDAIDSDLDKVQLELDKQTGVLGRQVQILEQIRDGTGG